MNNISQVLNLQEYMVQSFSAGYIQVFMIAIVGISAITISIWIIRALKSKASNGSYRTEDYKIHQYFTERPDDVYWSRVTRGNLAPIHAAFIKLIGQFDINAIGSSKRLDRQILDRMERALGELYSKRDPEFYVVLTLVLQYSDAQEEDRKKYADIWVAIMVDRDPIALPPEHYIGLINKNPIP